MLCGLSCSPQGCKPGHINMSKPRSPGLRGPAGLAFLKPEPGPAKALCRARLGLIKPGPGSARPEGLGRALNITIESWPADVEACVAVGLYKHCVR